MIVYKENPREPLGNLLRRAFHKAAEDKSNIKKSNLHPFMPATHNQKTALKAHYIKNINRFNYKIPKMHLS